MSAENDAATSAENSADATCTTRYTSMRPITAFIRMGSRRMKT